MNILAKNYLLKLYCKTNKILRYLWAIIRSVSIVTNYIDEILVVSARGRQFSVLFLFYKANRGQCPKFKILNMKIRQSSRTSCCVL